MTKELENNAVIVTTDFIYHAAHSTPSDISKDFFSELLLFPDGQTNLQNIKFQKDFSVPLKKLQWPTKSNVMISEHVH